MGRCFSHSNSAMVVQFYVDTDGDRIMFQVCRNSMNYYVNDALKVKWLTSLTCSGRTFHLDGTSGGSWSSSRVSTVPSSVSQSVIDNVLRWWKKCQANEIFGFTDTDGDAVAFELCGRYMNYWVRKNFAEATQIQVRHLSKLRLDGRTFHLDGTSTGSHDSSRVTTATPAISLQDLNEVVDMFKKRPAWGIFCIGSAGHGSGTAKAEASKDDMGLLDTKTDIEDCKAYINTHSSHFEFYGSYEVSGRVGSADACKTELANFYKYCQERKLPPVVYYTGHGDTDGDWCFPDGGYITLKHVLNLNTSGWKPTIWCDCCYSGKWAHGADGKARIIAAANSTKKAINRVFAKAVFGNKSEDQDRLWSSSIDAVMVDFDASEVKYFRGSSGPWPEKK